MTAVLAPQAKEAVLGEPAAQVLLERAPHVPRQRTCVVFVGVAHERRKVLAHERVQHRALGPVALVATRGLGGRADGHLRRTARVVPE